MAMMVPRAAVCADRIQEVLDTDPSVVPPDDADHGSARARDAASCDDVNFSYPGADAPGAQRRDLHAEPGQTVAVIG